MRPALLFMPTEKGLTLQERFSLKILNEINAHFSAGLRSNNHVSCQICGFEGDECLDSNIMISNHVRSCQRRGDILRLHKLSIFPERRGIRSPKCW
jgi:hypothetical protein